MHPRRVLIPVLVLAMLAAGGCKDQREPVKPIVDLSVLLAS